MSDSQVSRWVGRLNARPSARKAPKSKVRATLSSSRIRTSSGGTCCRNRWTMCSEVIVVSSRAGF
ncbi:hypothetical protein STRMOE7_24275 [Streptomyces sp. MOE7]|nr:hypothetical protein STRMOE7_24275 [Streptomyces sp. MOE7]